jgi:hypothetical protein
MKHSSGHYGAGRPDCSAGLAAERAIYGPRIQSRHKVFTPHRGDWPKKLDIWFAICYRISIPKKQFPGCKGSFMKIPRLTIRLFLLVASLMGSIHLAMAQGAAFTYQGRLNDGSSPAGGTYDLRFTIYDSTNNPGIVIAGPITNSAVVVSNGLFTVMLDFGAGAFDGGDRWLEIGVRTNAVGAFSVLSPRQQLSATPYALRAANFSGAVATTQLTGTILPANIADGSLTSVMLASNAVTRLSAPDGSPTNAVQVDGSGFVGVGTSAPFAGLHITSGPTNLAAQVLFQVEQGMGSFSNLIGASDVAYHGPATDLLAVSAAGFAGDAAVTVLNVNNLSAPVVVSSVRDGTGAFTNLAGARGLAFRGDVLVVAAASDNAVTLISLTNPAVPVRLSVLRDGVGGFNELGGAYHVAVSQSLLAIAARNDNAVTLVNVSSAVSPVLHVALKDGMFGFNDLAGATHVDLGAGLLIVAAQNDNAVNLISVTNPANPVLLSVIKDGVGGFNEVGGAASVARFGALGQFLAIAANADDAVTLVDISNPSAPQLRAVMKNGVGAFTSLDGVRAVRWNGALLGIAAEGDAAVTLVDVTDASNPVWRGTFRNGLNGISFMDAPQAIAFISAVLAIPSFDFGSGSLTLLQPVAGETAVATEGWVGIGTSRPVAPLHVLGNVIVEGAQHFEVDTAHVELGTDVHAIGDFSTAFGRVTTASGYASTAMGEGTTASGVTSVAMGSLSTASGFYSFAMGNQAKASGNGSVAMGNLTVASGDSAVALGNDTQANGNNSFAAGRFAKADHNGAFVWADSTPAQFRSSANDQFLIRASGGVGIGTTNPLTRLTVAGSGPFNSIGAAAVILNNTAANGRDWQWHALDDGRMQFADFTANLSRLLIDTNGNVGMGTSAPEAPLHVAEGSAGTVTANANSIATFERSGNAYLSVLTPTNNESGVLFGNPLSNADGGVFYNSGGTRGLSLRTAGNATRMVLDAAGNVGIGTSTFGTSATEVLAISTGTAPTTSPADSVQLYAAGASAELFVRDEAGNATVLSPHNFSLAPRSEPMAWSYYSENQEIGEKLNVDMLKVVRLVEQLSGEKLVHRADLSGKPVAGTSAPEGLAAAVDRLTRLVEAQQREIEELKKRLGTNLKTHAN